MLQRLHTLQRIGQPPTSSANALLLVADYGCGGHLSNVCNLYAPLAAQSVRRASRSLGLPLVDLHRMGGPEMIVREYAYTMHPTTLGACVAWNAIAYAESRIPAVNAADSYCMLLVNSTARPGSRKQELVALLRVPHSHQREHQHEYELESTGGRTEKGKQEEEEE